MGEQSEHAYFSPSGSERWINCPASLALYEELGEEKENRYAVEGVICHEIAANCLVHKTNVSEYSGQVVKGVTMTPELIDGMQMYVDEVKGLTKEFEAIGGRIEQKVNINTDCWGTVDALIWSKDTLVCIDLKMGSGVVVAAQDNTQLKIYSAGSLKWLYEKYKLRPTKVVNYIIQPRTPNPIRKAEYTTKEILKFMHDEIVPILRMKQTGELKSLPCTPGEKQCRWCRIKDCTARASKALADAAQAFAPFTEEEAPVIQKNNSSVEIEELVKLKKNFKFITDWIKSVDEYLFEKALAGENIPGYKLVAGRANRKWSVTDDVVATLLIKLDKEPYIKKIVSPAQAEKLLGKKVAKEQKLGDFITKPEGKPTLVEKSDKRTAIKEVEKEEIESGFAEPMIIPDCKHTEGGETTTDTAKPRRMSVMERMRIADVVSDESDTRGTPKEVDEANVTPEVVKEMIDTAEETVTIAKETATVVEEMKILDVNGVPKPPKNGTKRRIIFDFGIDGLRDRTITSIANELSCTINMVRMHLRYINERDGYCYKIYSDDTFVVY